MRALHNIMRATWALTLLVVSLPPAASAAAEMTACPVTLITCGDNITLPGRYRLAADCPLDGTDGTAIGIRASDVHLDLAGHTVSGPSTQSDVCTLSSPVGISVDGSNVHVHGGTVEGFLHGILVFGDDNHLNGLTVRKNCHGLHLSGAHDNGAHDNHVNGNNVSGNFGNGVTFANGSKNNNINSNDINDNGRGGVLVLDSDDNVISSNNISGNKRSGVALLGSNNNTIRSNRVNDHALASGIYLRVSNNNNMSNNNTIEGNTAKHNNIGIELELGVSGNFIRGNTALENTFSDLRDVNSSCMNTWKNNTFFSQGDSPAGCIE